MNFHFPSEKAMLGVYLFFDASLKAVIQDVQSSWRLKASALGVSARFPIPRICLNSFQVDQREGLVHVVETLARHQQVIEIDFGHVGMFLGNSKAIVLFARPSHELLELHSQLWEGTNKLKLEGSQLYGKDIWIPHCSLVLDSTRSLSEYLAQSVEMRTRVSGRITELAVMEIPGEAASLPYSFELQGGT